MKQMCLMEGMSGIMSENQTQTADPAPGERPLVRIVVRSTHGGCDDWPTGGLADFITWFHEALEEVPAAQRHCVECTIGVDHYEWDEYYPTIEICYWRQETDEEIAASWDAEAARNAGLRQQEIYLLHRLLEKYPEERGVIHD
jgi:hypothetical protein